MAALVHFISSILMELVLYCACECSHQMVDNGVCIAGFQVSMIICLYYKEMCFYFVVVTVSDTVSKLLYE